MKKKKTNKTQNDDMLPEYNLEGKKGVREKYAKAMREGYSVVKLLNPVDLINDGRKLRDAQLMLVIMGDEHFRKIAFENGVNWDNLTDEEQIRFVSENLG